MEKYRHNTRQLASGLPNEFDEGWYDEEGDAYDALLRGIAFVRMGWGYERLHELHDRAGYRLLMAICAQPYLEDDVPSVALLESLAPLVPATLLLQIPRGGLHPTTLRERLGAGRFAAAADFGDWIWGETNTAFLDFDDEVELRDDDWTPENVALLTDHWRRADAILTRIDELATWLEGDPPARFAALLRSALAPAAGRDAAAGGEAAGQDDRDVADRGPQGGTGDAASPDDDPDPDDRRADEEEGAARAPGTDAAGQPLPARRAA